MQITASYEIFKEIPDANDFDWFSETKVFNTMEEFANWLMESNYLVLRGTISVKVYPSSFDLEDPIELFQLEF